MSDHFKNCLCVFSQYINIGTFSHPNIRILQVLTEYAKNLIIHINQKLASINVWNTSSYFFLLLHCKSWWIVTAKCYYLKVLVDSSRSEDDVYLLSKKAIYQQNPSVPEQLEERTCSCCQSGFSVEALQSPSSCSYNQLWKNVEIHLIN